MEFLLKNLNIFTGDHFVQGDLLLRGGLIAAMGPGLSAMPGAQCFDLSGCTAFPGLADVHVHLREPGFSRKETIASGTRAAAHGGFTAVCAMPNLNPVPDCPDALRQELSCIHNSAVIHVVPYGAITRGQKGKELADMAGMAAHVCGFSDDGVGVADAALMRQAMSVAKQLRRPIVAHCEDLPYTKNGVVHDGDFARAHGLPGNPSESEWRAVMRDLNLLCDTPCAYHVCHVSTHQSVTLIRQARRAGFDVTCETAPHYLLLDDSQLEDDGRFRMNPPIRSKKDRKALLDGLLDGTIDMIATDHAPHTAAEKAGGLRNSLNGVVGLETAFPVLYSRLVCNGTLSFEQLWRLMCLNPRRRFGLGGGRIIPGVPADLTVFDLNATYCIDSAQFLSQGRATPFEGWRVHGRCRLTFCNGRMAYLD